MLTFESFYAFCSLLFSLRPVFLDMIHDFGDFVCLRECCVALRCVFFCLSFLFSLKMLIPLLFDVMIRLFRSLFKKMAHLSLC